MPRHACAILAVLLAAACKREAPPPAPEPTAAPAPPAEVAAADLDRGKAIAGELKTSLVGKLTQAMGSGTPAAIEVCHVEAPALAAALSRDGVTVGRATRKPRNPKNLAAGWQADAIAHFEELQARKAPLAGERFARRLPDGRIGYAEPLVIQELCLACHGQAIAPEVTAVLAAKYPEDRATGYAVGDLRGVVWVDLPPK